MSVWKYHSRLLDRDIASNIKGNCLDSYWLNINLIQSVLRKILSNHLHLTHTHSSWRKTVWDPSQSWTGEVYQYKREFWGWAFAQAWLKARMRFGVSASCWIHIKYYWNCIQLNYQDHCKMNGICQEESYPQADCIPISWQKTQLAIAVKSISVRFGKKVSSV